MKSISTPKSLTTSSHDILAVPICKMGDLSKDFLPTAIAWICLHAIKMKPIYEYITFLLQNIYYLVKIWSMKRKGVVVCIVV
jgi:hypothetical protein